jgi:hypothetical protein
MGLWPRRRAGGDSYYYCFCSVHLVPYSLVFVRHVMTVVIQFASLDGANSRDCVIAARCLLPSCALVLVPVECTRTAMNRLAASP